MERQLSDLQEENHRLRELVQRKGQGASPAVCGYLLKHRPYATMSSHWSKRWFCLNGSSLTYYRKEQDTSQHPRGLIDIRGMIVECEGLKQRKFHTFNILDPRSGFSLIRGSCQEEDTFKRWIQALELNGCSVRQGASMDNTRDPPAASDVRWREQGPEQAPEHVAAAAFQPTSAHERSSAGDTAASSEPDYTSESGTSDTSSSMHATRGLGSSPAPHKPGKHSHPGPMLPSAPVHTECRSSPLSGDRFMHDAKHSGILTLMVVVLVCTNLRLILENFMKYGWLVNPAQWMAIITISGNWHLHSCWAVLGLCTLMAYWLEVLSAKVVMTQQTAIMAAGKKDLSPALLRKRVQQHGLWPERFTNLMVRLNLAVVFLWPSYTVFHTNEEAAYCGIIMMITVVHFMKLVSYSHANQDYRLARRQGKVRPGERGSHDPYLGFSNVRYPENITLQNLGHFLLAPTLCYQAHYPKSSRFRVRWLFRRMLQLLVTIGAMLFIVEQYITPTVKNSIAPISESDWPRIIERVLKLALPCLYGWLCMFAALFHLWLNVVAELTHFGDREFYKAWWDSKTVGEYWRLWNMPVHKWMLRHVYYPTIRVGANKLMAGLLVFFLSAVGHELLVGLPLHVGLWNPELWSTGDILRFWGRGSVQWPYAFFGLMSQVPMMWCTEWLYQKVQSKIAGNVIFWVSFCIIGTTVPRQVEMAALLN
ncbi:hypothetical protein WJX84_002695 [Apatococcus fuscideae]|uniref:diacylglycerol O-acyltransferase n=1 Tax=Apatococcus fuscideae TaxID=2026836 RepID=A0AAW1SU43_9CHLO